MNRDDSSSESADDLIQFAIECRQIEAKLRKYRLWANLIPANTWYCNLRKVLPKAEWDILRKKAYKQSGHHCQICSKTNIQLQAHEAWTFEYEKAHQRLEGILALCKWCHHCQHLGLANILIQKKSPDKKKLVIHWCKTNGSSEEEFAKHEVLAFHLWRLRNPFPWKLVDKKGNSIEKLETASQVRKLFE